jgi:hypothetical protein
LTAAFQKSIAVKYRGMLGLGFHDHERNRFRAKTTGNTRFRATDDDRRLFARTGRRNAPLRSRSLGRSRLNRLEAPRLLR